MTGLEIGLISVLAIVALIYAGMHVGIALSLVSFVSVVLQKSSFGLATKLLTLAAVDGIANQTFAVIPLFVLMGLIMSDADVGRDSFEVGDFFLRRIRGGLGLATIGANAVFAAVTGVSIASAAVFTKVAVPEMLRYGYNPRFAVGAVAGSSVLGMLIPPSILLIIYGILTEQSIGQMFFAGIGPGLLLTAVYCIGIVGMAFLMPGYVYDLKNRFADLHVPEDSGRELTWTEVAIKMVPLLALIFVVLGGIYGGVMTPTEAGAVGALGALVIAIARRRITLRSFWNTMLETGRITASVCFLIIAATMYSRSLALAGMPMDIAQAVNALDAQFGMVLLIYIIALLLLGTILDSVSILLIMVPIFLPVVEAFGADPVWFGILSVIGVEVGLLTPPLGLACFVVKGCLEDKRITLVDVFLGALPFALMMVFVLILISVWPHLVYINQWF
ncbi:TRAP transporter large permease [Tranquillimonas rosea]|uniref:TRAP transporter large permease n=1 Tax=Tranquillimonas rosea TaxID=641238 RepID=UPI003BAA7E37